MKLLAQLITNNAAFITRLGYTVDDSPRFGKIICYKNGVNEPVFSIVYHEYKKVSSEARKLQRWLPDGFDYHLIIIALMSAYIGR